MGHREEEHDHKAISSFTSRGVVNRRARLLRSKSCTHLRTDGLIL